MSGVFRRFYLEKTRLNDGVFIPIFYPDSLSRYFIHTKNGLFLSWNKHEIFGQRNEDEWVTRE